MIDAIENGSGSLKGYTCGWERIYAEKTGAFYRNIHNLLPAGLTMQKRDSRSNRYIATIRHRSKREISPKGRHMLRTGLTTVSITAFTLLASAQMALANGDAQRGRLLAASCAACHGHAGISQIPNYPNIAGQKYAYLVKSMQDYQNGNRKDPIMKPMAMNLSIQQIHDLAAYYSRLSAR